VRANGQNHGYFDNTVSWSAHCEYGYILMTMFIKTIKLKLIIMFIKTINLLFGKCSRRNAVLISGASGTDGNAGFLPMRQTG